MGTLLYAHGFSAHFYPVYDRPARVFNEAWAIYVANNDYRVCIERIESTHPLKRILTSATVCL
jgi:hypothetical protein